MPLASGWTVDPPTAFTSSFCSRIRGSAAFQALSPFLRYSRATLALRLSSPLIHQSKPAESRVGASTEKVPAVVALAGAFFAAAAPAKAAAARAMAQAAARRE